MAMTPGSARPRVSIVMPVYNVERYLDETIQSVVAQSLPDWELIVVDDSSTDGTSALVAEWSRRDARIRSFSQERRGKPAFGRNRGIRESRGEIVTFLDGDDLYHPDKLARQVAILDALPEIGALFHDHIWFRDGEPLPTEGYLRHLEYMERSKGFFTPVTVAGETVQAGSADLIKFFVSDLIGVHTSSIAVRRSVLDSLGPDPFNEILPHGEDIDLWLRIGLATRMAYHDVPLSYYRYHPSSWVMKTDNREISRGLYEVNTGMLRRVETMLTPEERPRYREKLAFRWYRVGRRSFEGGLRTEARDGFVQALMRTRNAGQAYLALKGIIATLLPRFLLHARWRRTGEGEFAPRPAPPPTAAPAQGDAQVQTD
jgi:glycosyltransferase involved in cell wall biosynthesis